MKWLLVTILVLLASCGQQVRETWYINPVTNVCNELENIDYHRFMFMHQDECHYEYSFDYEDYYYVCDFHNLDWYFFKSEHDCLLNI